MHLISNLPDSRFCRRGSKRFAILLSLQQYLTEGDFLEASKQRMAAEFGMTQPRRGDAAQKSGQ